MQQLQIQPNSNMQQTSSQSNRRLVQQNNKSQALDGPPLDFSFKNIRSLQQLKENLPTSTLTPTLSLEQKDKATLNPKENLAVNAASKGEPAKRMGPDPDKQGHEQPDEKLQIVRTIETNDHNYLESQQKKTITEKQKKEQKVRKIVTPITTSLLLRYNKLTDIQNFLEFVSPIFPSSIGNLMWVDLSHNRLTTLSHDLAALKNLKTLYLHVNYISNFKELEKLRNSQLLRTLTIHANPLETCEQFRVIIHHILPGLKKIDSTLLTKRETQRAEVLMKTMKKYPLIKNFQKHPQESENEEDQDT